MEMRIRQPVCFCPRSMAWALKLISTPPRAAGRTRSESFLVKAEDV